MMTDNNNAKSARYLQLIIYFLFGVMFFFAVSATMTGILIPEIAQDYGLSYVQIGGIGSIQSMGGFAATLFGGIIADRFPKLRLMCITFTLYTLVLFLVGVMPPYVMLMALFLLLGITNGYLNLLISAYVSDAFPQKRGFYLNMCHAFFSFGSLCGPVYAAIAQESGQKWNDSFVQLSVLCIVILLIFIILLITVRDEKSGEKQEWQGIGIGQVIRDRRISLLAILCMTYMGQQQAVGTWITSYSLNVMETTTRIASATLIFYWAGIMAGRFLQSAIGGRIQYRRWLLVSCFISACLLILAFGTGNGILLVIVLGINGILTGAAFPSIIGMACECRPEQSGAATSVICLSGSIGSIIYPMLLGKLTESVGSLAGIMIIPMALLLSAVLLYFYGKVLCKSSQKTLTSD